MGHSLQQAFFLSTVLNTVYLKGGAFVGKSNVGLRLALLLLAVVLLWYLLGAPRTAAEWDAAPGQFTMAWNQLPVRITRVFGQWAWGSAQAVSADPGQSSASDWKAQVAQETDWPIRLYDEAQGKVVTIPLEQYVAGVVAAEMPASYHLEALKAQAVAARTRAVRSSVSFGGTGCSKHTGADICSDSTHCQGYLNAAAREQKWGASTQAYEARIFRAVKETQGSIMTYDGEPITVLYHAVSGGHTEDVEEVFAQSLPYLRGVESKGEENTSKYQTSQTFDLADAANTLNKAFPGADLLPDTLALQISITQRTKTGRVSKVQVGNKEVTAGEFRAALSLNSAMFTVTSNEKSITFSEKGYGHGVGMSQAGANAMGASGASWQNILEHYYTGIQITVLPAV
jgi:stage II sporulation protein D